MRIPREIYDIDWDKFVLFKLPFVLRQRAQPWAWVRSLLQGMIGLYNQFISWSDNTRYNLIHTGQVIYLEKVLNEFYNVGGYDPNDHENTKQIIIKDGNRPERFYMFRVSENKPVYFRMKSENAPVYMRMRSEYDSLYSDFIVCVPSTITFNEQQMRALIDYYKLAGKIYTIEIV